MAANKQAGARPRTLAARAVAAVVDQGQSLDDALAVWPADLAEADASLARAMAYGTLREHRRLGALIAPRLKKNPQSLLDALLRVGIYQLEAMRVPAHAAVHATVAAAQNLKLGKARGLVNAILRQHQRDPVALTDATPALRYSYPDWLAAQIMHDWGDAADAVLAAGNERAPMHVRINRRRSRREAMCSAWEAAGIAATPLNDCADGATLSAPIAAQRLPGFVEGQVSIQDGAAQLAADLLAVEDGHRVLDACAAPGNKSAHLLEREDIALTALDVDAMRLDILRESLARLGLSAEVRTGDASTPATWWDGQPFDRILLDAPCSGTGVIRRHPDIKWLRRPGDIVTAATRQAAMLAALWPTLAPGGRMVYATCSILAAEGREVVADFLQHEPTAISAAIHADWGRDAAPGRRIAPGERGFDGFYYAVLEKSASP